MWKQAPGLEGTSKLLQVSSEPVLDACTLPHSSELPWDLSQEVENRPKGSLQEVAGDRLQWSAELPAAHLERYTEA